jgi:hypothetical protein
VVAPVVEVVAVVEVTVLLDELVEVLVEVVVVGHEQMFVHGPVMQSAPLGELGSHSSFGSTTPFWQVQRQSNAHTKVPTGEPLMQGVPGGSHVSGGSTMPLGHTCAWADDGVPFATNSATAAMESRIKISYSA